MLAKVHLKTACGCTKTFFDRMDHVYPGYSIPLSMPVSDYRGRGDFVHYSLRRFILRALDFKSKSRVELWYEEAYDGDR